MESFFYPEPCGHAVAWLTWTVIGIAVFFGLTLGLVIEQRQGNKRLKYVRETVRLALVALKASTECCDRLSNALPKPTPTEKPTTCRYGDCTNEIGDAHAGLCNDCGDEMTGEMNDPE